MQLGWEECSKPLQREAGEGGGVGWGRDGDESGGEKTAQCYSHPTSNGTRQRCTFLTGAPGDPTFYTWTLWLEVRPAVHGAGG